MARKLAHLDRPPVAAPKRGRRKRLEVVKQQDVMAGMDALFAPAPAAADAPVLDAPDSPEVLLAGVADVRSLDEVTADLQRLARERAVVEGRLLAMDEPDEDRMKLYVRQLDVIAQGQRELMRLVGLYHAGALRESAGVHTVRVEICDGVGAVEGVL